MNIFLDTNILLDISQKRAHYEEVDQVVSYARRKRLGLCTSDSSLLNFHYISAKIIGRERVRQEVSDWLEILSIVSTSQQMLRGALKYAMKDWEDAVQLASAEAAGCEYLVTGNLKDYTHPTTVKVVSPSKMLLILANENLH